MRDYVINSSLIDEWNWKKNNELNLKPDKITLGSRKKPWWICKYCGYEWSAFVYDRDHGKGCPKCAKKYQTSSQEMKVYYYLSKYFTDAISSYDDKEHGISEIDVYIPSLKVGVEYDGGRWHTNIENDRYKDEMCQRQNIRLIRIREYKCPKYDSNCMFIFLKDTSMKELKMAIEEILDFLEVENIDIDFKRDLSDIESLVSYIKTKNSLATLYPDIAAEWHPIKNGKLKPDHFLAQSEKSVWWLCKKCGYEYTAIINNRTSKHSGCANCAGNLPMTVYCPELNQSFYSMSEAERQTGVFHGHISRCIHGELKHAGRHPVTGEKLTWIEV